MTPREGRLPVWLRLRSGALFTFTLAFVLSAVRPAAAQSPGTASISGTVRDATGGVLEGAAVEAHAARRAVAATVAARDGGFRLEVPAGLPYELRVRQAGFAEQVVSIAAVRGDVVRDITMQVGGVSDTLIVTASRAPESRARVTDAVSVLTDADLAALGSASLADALRYVPGLNVSTNGREGALTSLFSRGGESDYNLVLIDGVRVNQSGGSFDFSRVAASEIDRVEVVRGAQSALYGSDAMGAVVQVFTRRAGPADRWRASGSLEGGTFGTWRGDAAVGGGAGGRMDYHLGASARHTDGAFEDRLAERDAFDDVAFDGAAGTALGSRATLRTSVRAAVAEGRLVGPIAYVPGDTGTSYDTRDLKWHLDASHLLGSRVTGSASVAYFRARAVSEDLVEDPLVNVYAVLDGTPGVRFPRSPRLVRLLDAAAFDALRAGGRVPGGGFLAFTPFGVGDFPFTSVTEFRRPAFKYQADALWMAGRLTGGYEYERETNPLVVGYEVENNALSVQQQFSLRDRWFASVGARLDDKSQFGSFLTPKLSVGGFLLPVRDGALSSVKAFLNAGSGIKSPQFAELFGGPGFDGNRDLEPERARSIDVGAELTFASQRARGSLIYFDNRFRDMVEFRSTGFTEDGLSDFVNVAGAEARGLEVEGMLQRPVRGFLVRGSYTFLHTEVTETTRTGAQFVPGQPLLRRPAHAGALRASYTAGPVTLHGDAEFRGRSHDSSFLFLEAVPGGELTDITVIPAYAVAGFTIDVRVRDGVTLFLRGNNVTNSAYETSLGFPGLPRTFMVGARFSSPR